MTVSTLRPSSTSTQTGALTGATGHAALSDDSDSTFIDFDSGEQWVGGLGDLTLPAGAVLTSTAVRVRCEAVAAGTTARVLVSVFEGLGIYNTNVGWSTPTTVTLPLVGGASNLPGTDTLLDAAVMTVYGAGTPQLRVYEAYLDVTYVTQPTVTVDSPSGSLATTNLPLVEWTSTLDSSGGGQAVWNVKIFDSAQYGAGSFDPATSTAVEEPGTVISGHPTLSADATSYQVQTALTNGTSYRAYVMVGQVVAGNFHLSGWEFSAFTIATDPPGTPSLTAAADSANARVSLSVVDSPGTVSSDAFEFQRSLDGTTWGPVRTLTADGVLLAPYVAATGEYSDTANGTSHALVLPAPAGGILADDLLVAVVGMDGNVSTSFPEGWVEIKDEAGNGSACRASVAWKRASGGESGTVTLTTAGSEGGGARILCVRGAHPDTDPEVTSGVNVSAPNGNPDSLNPSGWGTEQTLWIACLAYDLNPVVSAAPSGYFGLGSTFWSNGAGAGVATAYRQTATSASDDPGAFTSAGLDGRAFTIGVRGASAALTVYDYEAPNNEVVAYRARALHDYGGEFSAGAWDTDSSAWQSALWWLKHPNRPDLNTTVTVRSMAASSRSGRQGIFQALGSTTAVVVADTRSPASGAVTFRSMTAAEQDALDALLEAGGALLLQSPNGYGGPDYIRVLGHERTRIVDGLPDASRVWETLPYVVVPSPEGVVVEWP